MKKRVSIFGMIFSVALVALVSSWLNSVEVNATTVLDFFKTTGSAFSGAGVEGPENPSEVLIADDMVPLAEASEATVEVTGAPAETIGEYRTELEATRFELEETKAKLMEIQAEIEQLKNAENGSGDKADEVQENDSVTTGGDIKVTDTSESTNVQARTPDTNSNRAGALAGYGVVVTNEDTLAVNVGGYFHYGEFAMYFTSADHVILGSISEDVYREVLQAATDNGLLDGSTKSRLWMTEQFNLYRGLTASQN